MGLEGTRWEDMEWVYFPLNRGKNWRALVKIVMNLSVPQNKGNSLKSWGIIYFWGKTMGRERGYWTFCLQSVGSCGFQSNWPKIKANLPMAILPVYSIYRFTCF
jgi:hypothetical protein